MIIPLTHGTLTKDSNKLISDDYDEIITRINGYAELNWIEIKGSFRGRDYGTAEIIKGDNDGVNLLGIRCINGMKKIFFERDVEYVYASDFWGHEMISMVPGHQFQHATFGWAFGNIEWH
jgi:hypothetical protein